MTSCPHTLKDIQSCHSYTIQDIQNDFKKLNEFNANENTRKFCGNKILYKYQFHNLLKCKREEKKYKTIEEIYESPDEIEKLWQETIKRNRRKNGRNSARDMYEVFRINRGAIVFFKSSTAKYIYKKYGATSILDPTAGWGGRMLGAASLGLKYTGMDTNKNLKEGYDNMRKDLGIKKKDCAMKWGSCFYWDFTKIDYDFVLTSPPYVNMELYEGMKPFESNELFYRQFLIPLMDKCFLHMKQGGHMCFNISPKMYKDLIKNGYRECDIKEDMRQQLGAAYKTKSQDYTYIWKK